MTHKEKKRMKVAFLDRDGVINKKQAEGDYVTRLDRFDFNPGVFEVLKRLGEEGFKLIVITNQRAIARGLMTQAHLEEIHDHMKSELERRDIDILDIFFCPHNHEECSCRKPKPGLLEQAVAKYDIDLAESVLISDSRHDVEMGQKFGVGRNIHIPHDDLTSLL